MKGLLWLLALFAAAVGASIVLEQGGYIVLVLPPWRIEVSLVLALLVLCGGFVLAYLAVRLASHALALPTHVRAFRARRHERGARRALSSALQALFEGRYGQVEKYASQAWESGAEPGLASLIAARAAQRRRDYARRDAWMGRAAASEPEWRRARLVIQAEQLLEERRFEEARGVLQELHTGGARHMATLQLLLRAEQGLGHWNESARLARVLEKREALPAEAAESIVLRARTAELSRVSHDAASLMEFWRSVPQKERLHPAIAAAAARAFMHLGDCRSAHRLIESALEAAWESELVLLYAECRDSGAAQDAIARIQRAEAWLVERPRDPDLLLTLGRLCAQCELWGKAQNYLEASLSAQPSRAAHVALAALFDKLERPDEANRHYRASAGAGLTR
jgi:HemY protein